MPERIRRSIFTGDSNKKEIDLIIYQDGIVSPVEIKKGSAPKDAVKDFSVLNPIEEEAASGGCIFRDSASENKSWHSAR